MKYNSVNGSPIISAWMEISSSEDMTMRLVFVKFRASGYVHVNMF